MPFGFGGKREATSGSPPRRCLMLLARRSLRSPGASRSMPACSEHNADLKLAAWAWALACTSAAPCRRILGGKRRLGGKSCQGRSRLSRSQRCSLFPSQSVSDLTSCAGLSAPSSTGYYERHSRRQDRNNPVPVQSVEEDKIRRLHDGELPSLTEDKADAHSIDCASEKFGEKFGMTVRN
jgi:hypothetical protein